MIQLLAALVVTFGLAFLLGSFKPDAYRWAPKLGSIDLVKWFESLDTVVRPIAILAIIIAGWQVHAWWTLPVLALTFVVVAHFAPEKVDFLFGSSDHLFHQKEWWKHLKSHVPAWVLPALGLVLTTIADFEFQHVGIYFATLASGVVMVTFPKASEIDGKPITDWVHWHFIAGVAIMAISMAFFMTAWTWLVGVAFAIVLAVLVVRIGQKRGWAWARRPL